MLNTGDFDTGLFVIEVKESEIFHENSGNKKKSSGLLELMFNSV